MKEDNKNLKVSFICTTYRRFFCVERLVSQYLSQTYKNKELIIFNTDIEYPYELEFEDDSIKIINNDIDYINKKPYNNRGDICRDAVTHATGDYFMLGDDDDIYLPWYMQQAVEGIQEIDKDAWKPQKSFFATQHKLELCVNTLEASVIVKMNRIREIGFRNDMTGYEGLSWYTKLRDEKQLDENNLNYIPSYCFNWSDSEKAGHKQSGDINNPNNFENHKLASNDYANRPLKKLTTDEINNVYNRYYEFFKQNINLFNEKYYNRYAKQFVESTFFEMSFNKNKNINMKPITGRNSSFLKVIDILKETYNEPITIVETGCIRNTTEESKIGDGWSTLNWDYYSKLTNSKVYVVDINQYHIDQSKKIVPPTELLQYYNDDSVNFLKNFDKKIDLLFIDSYDYCGDEENIHKCHLHSLNEVKSAWDKLNNKCFILIDDVFNNTNWAGKGELSIPYLLENGFELVYYIDSQVLLKRI